MSFVETWKDNWETALSLWSNYVKLTSPTFLMTEEEEKKEGGGSSFASIRLTDHRIMIAVSKIKKFGLEDYPLEIMGHEIGHHVYCPGDLTDQARLIYLVQTAMPRYEHLASLIVNIYEDLFINDKLKRQHNLRMEEVYQKIGKQDDKFWNFYMRTYEILWALPESTLTTDNLENSIHSDAILVNRIVRNYSNDWLRGAFDFGNICYPYFIGNADPNSARLISIFHDTKDIGSGAEIPNGITDVEIESILGEGLDPSLGAMKKGEASEETSPPKPPLSPSQYSAICAALGVKATKSELAYKYYKEKALPYLVSFPSIVSPGAPEAILEGTDLWDIGSPIENINWFESLLKGPAVIPGYTTIENHYGEMPSFEIESNPIDLDLFVDCSGSMPDPQSEISYLAIAGAIIALSALRVGSKVRATLWSGENEYFSTEVFTKNEKSILEILTGYIGGGTCFPLGLLKKEYENRPKNKKKTHILVISDEGIDTMYNQKFEKDTREFVKLMLENAGGGGSMVLNLYSSSLGKEIQEMKDSGWMIYRISSWGELIDFSKNFVKKTYERNKTLHKTN
jgi:hypothetical protein